MSSERPLAVVLVFLSAGYLAAAFTISEPIGQYAVVGPRAFPIAVGVGLIICSVGIGLPSSTSGPTARVDWPRLGACALVFLVYLALLEPVGYLLSTAALIPLEARLLGSRSWSRNALTGLTVALGVWGLLDRGLGLPLPSGWLG